MTHNATRHDRNEQLRTFYIIQIFTDTWPTTYTIKATSKSNAILKYATSQVVKKEAKRWNNLIALYVCETMPTFFPKTDVEKSLAEFMDHLKQEADEREGPNT